MPASSSATAPDGASAVTLPNGLSVGVHAVGPADGVVLFHHHGGPGSRLEVELFTEAAHAAGVRIIGVDRFGIGLSSPVDEPGLSRFGAHMTGIADALGVGRFAVSGWSEGGPWALACAHGISPERLALTINCAGGCYGAFGPNWSAPLMSKVDRIGGLLAIHLTPAFELMYDALEWEVVHRQEDFWSQLMNAATPYDRALCAREGFKACLLASEKECFRQGAGGLIADALALYRQWDFDVSEITAPVIFLQGSADTFVPRDINRKVAEATPGAIWREIPEAGHFVMVGEIARTLGDVKAALAVG